MKLELSVNFGINCLKHVISFLRDARPEESWVFSFQACFILLFFMYRTLWGQHFSQSQFFFRFFFLYLRLNVYKMLLIHCLYINSNSKNVIKNTLASLHHHDFMCFAFLARFCFIFPLNFYFSHISSVRKIILLIILGWISYIFSLLLC